MSHHIGKGEARRSTPQERTSPTDQLPRMLVDALHAAFGTHHARAVHAKGMLLDGSFMPSAEARTLSKAALFRATKPVHMMARFSNFTGFPDIPDTSPNANPRGLALKFLPSQQSAELDIVAHSFNGFPAATSVEFRQFLLAIAQSGPGVFSPTPIELFLDAHPIAKDFVTTQKPPPVSYATLPYFGVNAFRFVNDQGNAAHVRYRFVPKAGEHLLDETAVASKDPNYLFKELPARLASGPIEFEWLAQLAESEDVIEDPSVAWPEDRQLVSLGSLVIGKVVTNQASVDRHTMFLPSRVPDGIELADPMLSVRGQSYPISFEERK